MQNPLLITGGAGFIGSNFIRRNISGDGPVMVNFDKLTYAGNLQNFEGLAPREKHHFVNGDICDRPAFQAALERYRPAAVVHFAAESHVDRSIRGPEEFVRTNINGTFHLLEESLAYWRGLGKPEREAFRFLHVSTDEVYGSLGAGDPPFRENNQYSPNSPYAASKAASDHLVRAYHHTYGLPAIITNCSNNYGPRQFPEKLIPLVILNATLGQPLPVYGDGKNVRDWLYVTDHCDALGMVLRHGKAGQTYNIGGWNEKTNLEVVREICAILDELAPQPGKKHASLITFVKDRPGHDQRYAMDASKIERELGWKPAETFASGIRKTVAWYLSNPDWVRNVTTGAYQSWIETQYR